MKVLIGFKEHKELFCAPAVQMLQNAGLEVITNNGEWASTEQFVLENISDVDAVVAGAEQYSRDTLERAAKLKAIARFGVGTDNIDLTWCREKNVGVSRIVNHNAVAEFAVSLILSAVKNLYAFERAGKAAAWDRFPMFELRNKTLGIVGFGQIGQRVAQLLAGFDMQMFTYDPFASVGAAHALNVSVCDTLEELLNRADIVTLHLPLTPKTEKMFDLALFREFKDGAFFINTARGGLVDEDALYTALTSGKLRGAALDVFNEEPLQKNNPLLALDNVLATPHAAALSFETNYNGSIVCAQSIIEMLNGEKPAYPVIWQE